MGALVTGIYWVSFVIAVGNAVYAWRPLGLLEDEHVRWATISAAASGIVFGLHHPGEVYLVTVDFGKSVSEGVEIAAILGLGAVMLSLYNFATARRTTTVNPD